MTRIRKPPVLVREEAYELAREAADERQLCGDEEGAGVIRELARDIHKIKLSEKL